MAGEPSLDEFELKLRYLACLDWGLVELEPRRRFSALMLRIGALIQGLKGLALRWKEAFTRELHLEAHRRLEALSEVIKRAPARCSARSRTPTSTTEALRFASEFRVRAELVRRLRLLL